MSLNSVILLTLILLMTGFTGLFFGLLLSAVMRSSFESLTLAQFFVYPIMFLSGKWKLQIIQQASELFAYISGVMWPFEGIPVFLQHIGRLMPFALASTAFRSILFKDSTITDPTVYGAFVVLSVWIIAQLALCFWFVREKDGKKRVSEEKLIATIENY